MIYKYVSAKRIEILTNEHIRFTQPSSFNDPFDTYPYFRAIARNAQIEEFIKSIKWDEIQNEKMKEAWYEKQKNFPIKISFDLVKHQMIERMNKQMPFMKSMRDAWIRELMSMKKPIFKNFTLKSILKGIEQAIGILCLSEKPDNLLRL